MFVFCICNMYTTPSVHLSNITWFRNTLKCTLPRIMLNHWKTTFLQLDKDFSASGGRRLTSINKKIMSLIGMLVGHFWGFAWPFQDSSPRSHRIFFGSALEDFSLDGSTVYLCTRVLFFFLFV